MMRFRALIQSVMVAGVSSLACAQPKPPPGTQEPLPVEVVLEDLAAAYSKTFAELVTVKFRAPGAQERVEAFTLRVQAGSDPESPPQKALLELGPLKVLVTAQRLVAVGTAIPNRYFERESIDGSLAATVAAVLPPLPLPQLSLAAAAGARGHLLSMPTPYTGHVTWTDASADTSVHPVVVTLTGAGPYGPVVITLNAEPARIVRLTAALRMRDGDGSLDLTCRAVNPGDPASWSINTEGRERVPTLAQLRPPVLKLSSAVQLGQQVPELTFSNPNYNNWSLHANLTPGPGQLAEPIVLLMYRMTPAAERTAANLLAAQAGRRALRAVWLASAQPQSAIRSPTPFKTAAVVIIELAEFKSERWDEAEQKWATVAEVNPPGSEVLLWSPSAAQSIDRFLPSAGAALVVVGPDRTLWKAVNLDGRTEDVAAITAELDEALRRTATKEAPSSEPPR